MPGSLKYLAHQMSATEAYCLENGAGHLAVEADCASPKELAAYAKLAGECGVQELVNFYQEESRRFITTTE